MLVAPRHMSLYSKRRGSVCCSTELHILRILRNSDSSFESRRISMQPSSTALLRTCSWGLSIKFPILRHVLVSTSYSSNLFACLMTDMMSLCISSSWSSTFLVNEWTMKLMFRANSILPVLYYPTSTFAVSCFTGL